MIFSMNTLSRTITGSIAIVLGLILIGVGFFTFFTLIYGIPLFIIGLFILFNKSEDNIEDIKSSVSKKQSGFSDIEKVKQKGGKNE